MRGVRREMILDKIATRRYTEPETKGICINKDNIYQILTDELYHKSYMLIVHVPVDIRYNSFNAQSVKFIAQYSLYINMFTNLRPKPKPRIFSRQLVKYIIF